MAARLKSSDKYMIFSAFAAAAGIMVLACSAVVSVHAYLSAQTDVKNNPFSPKNFTYTNTAVVENPDTTGQKYTITVDTEDTEKKGTLKYSSQDKTAYVQNLSGEDKKPVFVRVTMVMAIYDENGVNVTRKYPTCQPVYTTTNDTKWAKQTVGELTYYYYKEIVAPDNRTENVFDSVKIKHADLLPTNAEVKIRVIADTVQAISDDDSRWTAADYATQNYATAEVHTAWDVYPTSVTPDDETTKSNATITSWSFES